jgi:hypothetical protein
MNARHIALLACFALFGAAPLRAAEPAGGAIVVQGPGGPATLTAEDIAALPTIHVTTTGARPASFEGPLLWTVLDHTHAIDTAKFHDQVRQTILLTGQDGYTAVIAMGEISPEFENKQVIVAERMDGKTLGQPRIVVPGDKRGGRGVHEVVRIAVLPAPGG